MSCFMIHGYLKWDYKIWYQNVVILVDEVRYQGDEKTILNKTIKKWAGLG